eukprot:UN23273
MEDHTFMTLFESGSLEKFDHYYKLKALYMYMIKDGKQQGFENASKYIKVYEKDKYNYTITYFWAHVVYYSQSTQVGSGFKTLIVVNKCNRSNIEPASKKIFMIKLVHIIPSEEILFSSWAEIESDHHDDEPPFIYHYHFRSEKMFDRFRILFKIL